MKNKHLRAHTRRELFNKGAKKKKYTNNYKQNERTKKNTAAAAVTKVQEEKSCEADDKHRQL